ncbi:hypothetical protein [Haliscomenobacter hydrossis]|uniref:Uncharacterized protein n=1 Tax=Haliscomenobacter hydrossis (strain ATCC 27775 / DSM 1100 / LMG 10767 / O) TaxID=760192 RepID=F4KYK8_HALH1|nr:hypothetical protein [Haliscomenobacter hydrossis]AEE50414.1 hypothetical protein Halhy_2541 [Haliscomenobacter hydrossis DSM 1100]
MKLVNVTVRGGNTADGATGVSFSVLPNEVVVLIPGSREPILNVPLVDNPLLNRQAYSFGVDGFEVDIEVLQVADEVGGDCGAEGETELEYETDEINTIEEEEAIEALHEVLGEPELESETTESGESTALEMLLANTPESAETAESPLDEATVPIVADDLALEDAIPIELHVPDSAAETAAQEEIVHETSASIDAPQEEEKPETAFFPHLDGGTDLAVETDPDVVQLEDESKNADELRHLLEQTQALLKKYDLNSVEH